MFPDVAVAGLIFIIVALVVVVPAALFYFSKARFRKIRHRPIEEMRTDVLDSPNLDEVRERQFRGIDKRVG